MSNIGDARQRRDELDGIRAIAVSAILFFHAGIESIPGGFIGVDIFFVLSGYLITALIVKELEQGKFALGGFYARRFTRLLPAALVTIVLTLLVSKLLMPAPMQENIFNSALSALFYVSNIFFLFDAGYFSDSAATKPLLHMWSLSVEEQFYLIYPFLLYFAHRAGGLVALKFTVLVATALSFALCVYLTYYAPSAAYYLMPSRFWQLGIGALLVLFNLAALDDRPEGRPLPVLVGIVGVLMVAAATVSFDEHTAFPGYVALLPVLGTALLVWSGAHSLLVQRILSIAPLLFIGRISYSLYLVHWPIAVFLFVLGSVPGTWLFAAQCIALAMISAVVLHYCVEKPCMALRRYSDRRVLSGTLVGSVAVAAVCFLISWLPLPTLSEKSSDIARLQVSVFESSRKLPCDYMLDGVCHFGKGKTKATVAFVGDSHALMIKTAVQRIAHEANVDFIVMPLGPYCPPLFEVNTYNKERTLNSRCLERRADLRAKLQNSGVEKVVLVGRWQVYAKPARPVSLAPEEFAVDDRERIRSLFFSALEDTVEVLGTMGIQTHFMEQVPESGCDVKKHLTQAKDVASFNEACPFLTRKIAQRRAGLDLTQLQSLAIRFILTQDAFCNDLLCRTYGGRRMFYDDSNHLTAAGSEQLGAYWLEQNSLEDLIDGS